ncbi:Autophagy-related protein 21 [Candida viswanathii]|uniref:Autophagy-related protein 21 n=1 Tax=Candida viswanathii TaxID=5486 RepID=A0A367Y638_9ASCO|nr:Autophagy-related protein 21 [Candida viswanathii]
MVIINDLSFNPDYSSISVSTSEGFKIFNCEPFGEFYSSQESPLRRSISNSLEETTASTPTTTTDDVSSNDATAFLKMLFSTSLTIVVPKSLDRPGNRLLKIYNLKQHLKICELNFPSSIIDIKLNRKRLLVILDTGQLYIYDLSCVRLLKILQLQLSGDDSEGKEFIGDLSADDKSWLILPISYTTSQTDLLNSEKVPSQPSTPRLKPSDSVVSTGSYDKYIELTRKSSSSTLNNNSKNVGLDDIKKDSEGWVVIYDTINLVPVLIFQAHNSAIGRICVSPKDNKIATASVKGTIVRVFHLKEDEQEEGKVKISLVTNLRRGHNPTKINALSFHNDNHILGCGSESNTIHLFKLSGDELDQRENDENDDGGANQTSDYDDSDGETSRSSEDLNENLANLLISKPAEPATTEADKKQSSSWFNKTKKLINNQYTSSIIKKLPYKDYFENLIWEPPRRSFAYIKLPEYIPHNEKESRSNKVEIGFSNDLVFIASYHSGNFYQYQIPKHRGSIPSISEDEKREECLLVSQFNLL